MFFFFKYKIYWNYYNNVANKYHNIIWRTKDTIYIVIIKWLKANDWQFNFAKLSYHIYFFVTIILIDSTIVKNNSKLSYMPLLLDNLVRSLSASIYHAQLIAGYLSNKKSVIKKICGLLLSRSWLARLARIWRGLLGIDRFNYSGCISVIVTTRAMQNFIGEYHFTYRHVFVRRIVFELDVL